MKNSIENRPTPDTQENRYTEFVTMDTSTMMLNEVKQRITEESNRNNVNITIMETYQYSEPFHHTRFLFKLEGEKDNVKRVVDYLQANSDFLKIEDKDQPRLTLPDSHTAPTSDSGPRPGTSYIPGRGQEYSKLQRNEKIVSILAEQGLDFWNQPNKNITLTIYFNDGSRKAGIGHDLDSENLYIKNYEGEIERIPVSSITDIAIA